MSDSQLSNRGVKKNPYAGLFAILLALLLGVVYFQFPTVTAKWPRQVHLLFRGLVVIVGLTGVLRAVLARLAYRPKFPHWFRLTQHRMTIPVEGWIYLAILVVLLTGAMLTKENTLLFVFALMAGPFVVNGWMTFGMLQAARVQRDAPQRAMQGELFSIELTLTNSQHFLALWMMSVRDEIQHVQEDLGATVLFSRVSPRTSQTGQYQLRLAHRGRYRLGPLRVFSRFPLGLVERSRVFSTRSEVLIYPRLGRISPNWRQRLVGATELVSSSQLHHGVFHDEFHRLREFRPGDNPRAIHWRSTARRGALILREFQQNREHALAIVLDLFKSASYDIPEQVEFALSFVTSLIVERGRECRDGYISLVATGAGTFRWEGHGNSSSLESLFDGMAEFEPGPATAMSEILNEIFQTVPSSTRILLVTTRTGTLPYQNLLTSRVDTLDLNLVSGGQLLIYEDVRGI